MKNLGITAFARRQMGVSNNSSIGGFTGHPGTFLDILGSYPEEELQQGGADFVRTVEIHKDDLHFFLGTFREARPGEVLTVRLEARRDGEDPVPVKYLIGEKESPTSARAIFYTRQQLDAEKASDGLDYWVEYGLVSINMGPKDEPMTPETLWRNYWASRVPDDPRAKGGSPHWKDRSDNEFIEELDRATRYWANRGRVVPSLPSI